MPQVVEGQAYDWFGASIRLCGILAGLDECLSGGVVGCSKHLTG